MIRRTIAALLCVLFLSVPQFCFALEGQGLSSPVAPSYGGVGKMTGAPMWARNFGDGSDGPFSGTGSINSGATIKMLTSWTCTGAVTFNNGLIIYSQGAVALNTGCSVKRVTGNSGTGNYGGAGGSGGSGAANSSAGSNFSYGGNTVNGGGASSSSAGNAGTAFSAAQIRSLWLEGPNPADLGMSVLTGGAAGSAGGSSGGAKGNGGFPLVIIAPTITIASGVIIDTSGFPGVAPTANSTGAGGGGGGGNLLLITESLTDSGGIYKYGGGPGGAITQPSIQATGGGCDSGTSGCGTGAVLTVTGVTTGGLDAAKITITNGGSGYQTAPDCSVNAGGSGLTGSPACHFTISGGAINGVVIDAPGSGATFTGFTTTFIGGYGANGFSKQLLIQ